MTPATTTTYDVLLDGVPVRLVSLEEWQYLQGVTHLRGITWRDADATRHRLLAEQYEQQAATADPEGALYATPGYYAEQAALHRSQSTHTEEPTP